MLSRDQELAASALCDRVSDRTEFIGEIDDMAEKKVALIGFGAIAGIMLDRLTENDPDGRVQITAVLVRENRVEEARTALGPKTAIVSEISELLSHTPDIVVECAGQGAVEQYGEAVLSAGFDFMIISTGALADETIRNTLIAAGKKGNARMVLPAGAIAGIDGLSALRVGGLKKVRYSSTKPPGAWKGTPADEKFDLESMSERTVLYTGPASEAARLYPKNANLAATVALAGLGMEKTEIQLVADPSAGPNNVGRIEAVGSFGELTVECRGKPAPDNPKTSATTGLSVAYALLRDTGTIIL